MVPRESDHTLRSGWDERELSPDGRTAIHRVYDTHPGDIHEAAPFFRWSVWDARTGELALDLGRFGDAVRRRGAWGSDGALHLSVGPVEIRVSVAEGTWAMSADGWQPHPIGADPAAARALLDPHLPLPAASDPASRAGAASGTLSRRPSAVRLIAVLGMAVLAIGAIALAARVGERWHKVRDGSSGIDSWLVHCPGDGLARRLAVFHREPDGGLTVPPWLAPGPLPRLPGEPPRYGGPGLEVRPQGTAISIVRSGRTMLCTPPAGRRESEAG